jgi:hypothetical protein
MNEEFDLDDFENLLRNQTEKHRIYPNDAVWRNINNNLHGNRRWPALTFSAIVIGAILTAGFILLHPNKNLFDHPGFIVENNNVNKNKIIVVSKQNNKLAPAGVLKPTDEKAVIYSINQMASPLTDMETVVEIEAPFNMPSSANTLVSLNEPVNNAPTIQTQTKAAPEIAPAKTASKVDNRSQKVAATNASNILQGFLPQQALVADNQGEGKNTDKLKLTQKIESQEVENKTIDKSAFPAIPKPTAKAVKEKIENPWEATFYITPSISYRTLSLDQSYDYHYSVNSALAGNPANDVNKFVTQSPALGFGAGVSVSYAISNRFRLTGGLQFNYRQYNFKAYVSSTQQASLLLNRGSYADSMVTYSNIRTAGVNAVSIGNYYFQLSVPIGFQYTAIQGKKVDILFGANLQPTYQFNRDMYMLTSDFKAYTMEPSLARRWNINTGVEVTARFKAAGLQWEVGPQLRYQMLPTQISNYIIHENLIDYGLKIGIVKQLK